MNVLCQMKCGSTGGYTECASGFLEKVTEIQAAQFLPTCSQCHSSRKPSLIHAMPSSFLVSCSPSKRA